MKMTYSKHYPPDGVYEAVVTKVEEMETDNGTRMRVEARVADGDEFAGAYVSALVRPALAGQSRLARWFSAAAGRDLEADEEVELEEMVGCEVCASVENQASKKGDVYPHITDMTAKE